MAKGFGPKKEVKKREKSEGQSKRDSESSKYDEIAETGGQQYNIFVRQFGGEDSSWLPTGSIAVPRGSQVSDAIFANQPALKSAIVRTYPKLVGFEEEFEFGFNLKSIPSMCFQKVQNIILVALCLKFHFDYRVGLNNYGQ